MPWRPRSAPSLQGRPHVRRQPARPAPPARTPPRPIRRALGLATVGPSRGVAVQAMRLGSMFLASVTGGMMSVRGRGVGKPHGKLQRRRVPSEQQTTVQAPSSEPKPPEAVLSETPDADLKERVRQSLLRKSYCVQDLYKTTGVWQRIARHPMFKALSLCVVAVNCLWIGIDVDLNRSDVLALAPPAFRFIEYAFTTFFAFEWFVQFRSFKRKRDGFRDGWFSFDTVLLFLAVTETWVMDAAMHLAGSDGVVGRISIVRMARLLRLARAARMARLFHATPEMQIMARGLVAAARSVCATLTVLALVLYVFALAFRYLTIGTALQELYFRSTASSMYTLLLSGVFLDQFGEVVRTIGAHSTTCAFLFWTFVLISSLTVMNMLIAVICESVSIVAASEKEAVTVNFVKQKLEALYPELDKSQDGLVSRREFLQLLLENPEAAKLLQDVGVDVIGLVDHVDALFVAESLDEDMDERTLNFDELVELVLSLRGCRPASVRDLNDLRKFTHTVVAQTNDTLTGLQQELRQLKSRPMLLTSPLLEWPHAKALEVAGTRPGVGQAAPGLIKADPSVSLAAQVQSLREQLEAAQAAGVQLPQRSSQMEMLQTLHEDLQRSVSGAEASNSACARHARHSA